MLSASSGGTLFAGEPAGLAPLVKRATIVTPNLAEAARLSGMPLPTSPNEARACGERLIALGARAVLIKGGHLDGDAVDWLVEKNGARAFVLPRLAGASPRGTGRAA